MALGWMEAGHEVVFGVRSGRNFKGSQVEDLQNVKALLIPEAASWAEVLVIAAVPQAVHEIANAIGDVSTKVVIDAMNSFRFKPEPFQNTTEALLNLTNCQDVVKCFNTTGAENLANPVYSGKGIDMFYAGDSEKARNVAEQLAKDLGFENVYNFGGNDKVNLLEQFALSWVNLAIGQGYGRGIAFKVLKR